MAQTIMIVDDSSSIRSVVGITLRGAGYTVVEACDGKDALGKLGSSKVSMIISDVNMPNMDGISLVKEVRKLPEHRFTPICMLTTESEQSKMAAGKEAGAKAWIVKPFQPDKLLQAVKMLAR